MIDSLNYFYLFSIYFLCSNNINVTTMCVIDVHKYHTTNRYPACVGHLLCLSLFWTIVRRHCCCCHCSLAAAVAMRLWCTLACLAKWSDRENRLSHMLQPYGLTPECERQCRDSSSDREKRQVQPGHMQPYGFSPECLRMCTCWAIKKKKKKNG